MFDWVIYRQPQILKFFQSESKVEQIIAIVTALSVSCLVLKMVDFLKNFEPVHTHPSQLLVRQIATETNRED